LPLALHPTGHHSPGRLGCGGCCCAKASAGSSTVAMISVFSICQPLFFTSFIFASWSAFCRLCFGFDAGIAPSSTDQSGARSCGPDRFVRFLVGLPPSGDLLPCAKHLFVAARTVWVRQETTTLRGFRPSAAAVYVGFGSSADQSRQARYVCLSPISGHQPTRRACPLCAMCGRLRVGKGFLHVCRLVGAAMCSAC